LHLSYRELNRRGGCLAGYLAGQGIGPESLLGILAGRSLETLVGMVGILRTGAAYLPLVPDYPLERLLFLLEDSGARMVLTRQALSGRLHECDLPSCCLDSDWERIQAFEGRSPAVAQTVPHSLAYVIYTSGSTGFPKGTAIVQRGLPYLASAVEEFFAVRKNSRMLQFASWSFDASVAEVASAWKAGAALVLLSQDDLAMGPGFFPCLRESLVTHAILPPSGMLAVQLEGPLSLETLIVGGEACPQKLAEQWAGQCRFINAYGPTEITVCATVHHCRPESPRPFIGSPIANVEAVVLDGQGIPVGAGIAGELYIGGEGLARCYLNRPALTAQGFVPHPFSRRPGRRLYRSGDLVRWHSSGVLDFLGRIDDQVKIRGYRVEPGEIEATLVRYPAVTASAVLARSDGLGGKRLVAYVASDWTPLPDSAELIGFLREELPEYLVPSAFVILKSLPLAPSGKIDRKALPEWGAEGLEDEYREPSTPQEELLAGIWSDLLGAESIGADDSFFERGGHSLLATQAVARISRAFEIEIPLRALFEAPTPASMAHRIEQLRLVQGGIQLPPLVPVGRQKALPLSFAQQRLWFLDRLHPNSPLYNIPSVHPLKGPVNPAALQAALQETARRHESLRTRFPSADGKPQQVIDEEARLPLPIVDLSALASEARSEELSKLAQQEAQRPFDLANGPLLRAVLILAQREKGERKTENGRRESQKESGVRNQESGRGGSIQNLEPEASPLDPVGSSQFAVGRLQSHGGTEAQRSEPSPSSVLRPPFSVLLLNLHHIIADGWSMGILRRELATLYSAFSHPEPGISPSEASQPSSLTVSQPSSPSLPPESVRSSQLAVGSSGKEPEPSASDPFFRSPFSVLRSPS
ncbi:MAG: amino acid adenylation domain-containing protein, partial [Acidobacteriota bacterium]